MKLLSVIPQIFYKLLYHQFAWMYDLVADTVSLGRWRSWVFAVIPYLDGKILEIGSGPGHLQAALGEKGFKVFGIDESPQMLRLAKRRLVKNGYPIFLTRGLAQDLPFAAGSFDTVVATFPSEYIFDPRSLTGIRRLLTSSGRLVILPLAWITGGKLPERLAAWLFRVTGEVSEKPGQFPPRLLQLITAAGFSIEQEFLSLPGSQVLLLVAGRDDGRQGYS